MRCWLAVRCFFKVLSNGEFAGRVRQLADGAQAPTEMKASAPAIAPPIVAKSGRSEAITLLAALQREARLVDLVSESLEGYSDSQIGAAARDVLRDAGKVLERTFALRPVVAGEEGQAVEIPANYETGRYRLTGNVSREPPFTGQLVHAGWQATKCELPSWTGKDQAALVVAPAEVQVE
jgi:hypothetical protein